MRWLAEPADERIRLALLRLFFEQSLISLFAAALLLVLHLAYAWNDTPRPLLLAWGAAFAALIVLRGWWRVRVLALDPAQLALQQARWRRRALLASGSTGLLWAAALLMVFDAARPSTTMYCAMLVCVTTVASINVMAPLPRAFAALALPNVLLLAALFLGLGSGAGVYYATLVLTALAMALAITVRHARLLRESHAMRYEREGLLAQAQQARDAQTRFLAAASHDLRQPVHALGLLAAHVQADLHTGGPGAVQRAAHNAGQVQLMAQVLNGLVDSLLDVSRLDGGVVGGAPQALPLAPLFDRLAPEFALLADERGLQWRLRPTDLWVCSDEPQLERMLRNLLVNALRYTSRGGVLLAARKRGSRVLLSVWDTGVGIAPEHQQRVFDEFVQLHNPGRDRQRGHGLGLAIVARLSRLLQHPVRLASRVGRGSCFTIELPLAAAPAAAAASPPPAAPELPALELPLSGLRIALVEDDDAVREASAALLGSWGCRVWAAAAVAPLLQQLRADGASPERVISDWRLADDNGLDAIAALRRHAGAVLPALLLSGETLPAGLALAEQHIEFARKPLPARALRAWLGAPPVPASDPAAQRA